ncbi:MAG: tetratricopeptide repeat protein [Roseiflexaceae bacterium]
MTRQDDKLRNRRRIQMQAVEMASKNRWEEAVELNRQLLEQEKDVETYNRLGKAYFELGRLEEARDAYQNALAMTANNPIARKNLDRIIELIARNATTPVIRAGHELVDQRMFVIEIGKTAITTLVDVPRRSAAAVVTGEKVELRLNGRYVEVIDASGGLVGRIEPKLAQRLAELMTGGNRYIAAIAQVSSGQVRVVLREVYQHPAMRDRISFPGKLSEGALRGSYIGGASYDDYAEEMLEDDDGGDDREEVEEETFGSEEEDLGLDEIEQDLGEDDDMGEE